MTINSLSYLTAISQVIFDKKGFNTLILDIRPISDLTEYVVIAEGHINVHVQAIAQTLIEEMKQMGLQLYYAEGMKEGDWVVLDFSHIVVHLFQPGWREKYQLEKLWRAADIVDVQIDTAPKFNQVI
jgi:ribosome-associated protein